MACATTRLTFSFHYLSQPSPPKPPKPHFSSPPPFPRLPLISLQPKNQKSYFTLHSIDISKEGTPTSSQPNAPPPPLPTFSPPQQELQEVEKEDKYENRRLEEKFVVLNTGIYECRSCGFKFDEAVGDPSYPIPPGLNFYKLPEDWRCPTCGAAKSFFESKSVEIAGFAQNQQYGLGGNSLTSGQKTILIYGSLLFFFVLFLSGYFIQ
ncbi:Rubredoxin domain-containing protein [Cephalotus follicularis]|uniref:Rubredoxin domain-containing protein n=1 Tax=Cephalotus follicularis TaxID=3775 RepID=A0A1Q3DD91_CEPFO|nr:Rubredoxin domain-containing protein [Cephalotus follicularis]